MSGADLHVALVVGGPAYHGQKAVGGTVAGEGALELRPQAYALKRMLMGGWKIKANTKTGETNDQFTHILKLIDLAEILSVSSPRSLYLVFVHPSKRDRTSFND